MVLMSSVRSVFAFGVWAIVAGLCGGYASDSLHAVNIIAIADAAEKNDEVQKDKPKPGKEEKGHAEKGNLATGLCDKANETVKEHCEKKATDCEKKIMYVDVSEDCARNVVLAEPDIFEGEGLALPHRNQEVQVLGCNCGPDGNFYFIKATNFCGFMQSNTLRSEKHPPSDEGEGPSIAVGAAACNNATKG